MKLGVITLQNAPWTELVERWRRLDELGVETIWVADHLGNWMHPEQPWFEAWRAALFAPWLDRLLELLADERLQPKREIPLTVAGRGKTILGLAARHAFRWNTFGGVGLTPEEGLRRGGEDNARLDELCAETGRTVLRSALIGHPFVAETPWRSDETFQDFVARWQEAGFEELVVYYPPETGMPKGSVVPGVFERAFSQPGPRRRALPADAGS